MHPETIIMGILNLIKNMDLGYILTKKEELTREYGNAIIEEEREK